MNFRFSELGFNAFFLIYPTQLKKSGR